MLLTLTLACALCVGVAIARYLSSNHGLGAPPTYGVVINGIAMVSPTEGWAVGDQYDYAVASRPDQGFILHHQRGTWASVAIPSTTKALTSVFMISASDGWVVGDSTILHYQAGKWSPVALPSPPSNRTSYSLSSVFMLSATNGWAVGDEALLHYHDGVWSQALGGVPAAVPLSSIAMVLPTEGWAVGNDSSILHYRDRLWQIVSSSSSSGASLGAIAMCSASDGWAVGKVIVHYSAGIWQTLKTRPRGILTALALVSADEAWAGGGTYASADEQGRSVRDALLLHYTQGQWMEVPVPVHA